MAGPRVLYIDIETSPNLAFAWGMFQQNIGLSQLVAPTEMLCFAAQWEGERVKFFSEWKDGKERMAKAAWDLLDQADLVVHYNGKSFDVKHLNREFQEQELGPPSPYKQLDLYQQVKKTFRLPSNKLQYVTTWLGLEGKLDTGGFDLWLKVMAGDEKAQAKFARYNKRDVTLMPLVVERLRPWLKLPNYNLYTPDDTFEMCPTCGSGEPAERRGFAYTDLGKFQQFRCRDCGAWFRGKKALAYVDLRST